MNQQAFYFDQTRCIGCRVCQIACKDRLGLEQVGSQTRRVVSYESGEYPTATLFHTSVSCNHCESPACVANCPTGAMYKDAEGIVLHDDDVCIGCKTCMSACPYSAPQFSEEKDLIIKCDSCKALRDAGRNPVCVDSCMSRALVFGDAEDLKAQYGSDLVSEIPCIGSADITNPNLLIKATEAAMGDDYREIVL